MIVSEQTHQRDIEPATRMEIIRLMSFLSFAWAVAGETTEEDDRDTIIILVAVALVILLVAVFLLIITCCCFWKMKKSTQGFSKPYGMGNQ